VEPIRRMIEGFLRGRYGLAELMGWAFRVLAVPVLIGAILVVGWLLVGPMLTIPRFSPGGPVVRNGVAAVVVCGKKSAREGSGRYTARAMKGMDAAMEYVPEPRTGGWWPEDRGECTVWYHRPPDATQRFNRQQRAATEGVRRSPSQFQRLPVVEKLPQSP
jgi:hypothetical protein